jgi:hypothetical protein
VITETEHPSSVEPSRRPWRNQFIVLAVIITLIGFVLLGFGIDLWVDHVSLATCVQFIPPRISQAMLNYVMAHCRSVGALHNRGIVLTFSGVSAVLIGFGTAFAARRSSAR